MASLLELSIRKERKKEQSRVFTTIETVYSCDNLDASEGKIDNQDEAIYALILKDYTKKGYSIVLDDEISVDVSISKTRSGECISYAETSMPEYTSIIKNFMIRRIKAAFHSSFEERLKRASSINAYATLPLNKEAVLKRASVKKDISTIEIYFDVIGYSDDGNMAYTKLAKHLKSTSFSDGREIEYVLKKNAFGQWRIIDRGKYRMLYHTDTATGAIIGISTTSSSTKDETKELK